MRTMKRDKGRKTLPNLFFNSFVLSMFAFGGGSTIIALLQKRYVEELKWIDEKDMMDMLTMAQSAPGATAVNTSILIGYRVMGLKGALVSALATALPPLLVIILVSTIYSWLRTSVLASNALRAMRACAVAMVASAALSLLVSLLRRKDLIQFLALIAAFAAMLILRPSTYVVILCGLAAGLVHAFFLARRDRKMGDAP